MRRIILTLLGVTLVASSVLAQSSRTNSKKDAEAIMKEGLGYYNGEDGFYVDHSKAYAKFLQAAQLGLDVAMLNVGVMLYTGDGVEQDYKGALIWYKKAAEKGLPVACINLGWYYIDGRAVEPDGKTAIEYFTRAFELGEVDAARILSDLYFNGLGGIEKDLSKMLEWNQKLASLGDANGLYNVGICYCRGYGVDVDEDKAIPYFEKAVNAGSFKAAQELVRLYYHERKDAKSAAKYIVYLALNGDVDSQLLFGNILTFGELGNVDLDNAFAFYKEAALQGNENAMCNVALCYLNGFGTAKNYAEADKYLKKAVVSSNQTISNYAKSIMSQYSEELSAL